MNAKSIDFDAYFEKLGRVPKGARYGAEDILTDLANTLVDAARAAALRV